VSFEGAPEWAGDYLDPTQFDASEHFDPSNDLHLERLASALHFAWLTRDDQDAFRRLAEIAAERIQRIGMDVAQDLGVLLPPNHLAEAFFSRLFIDRSRPDAPVPHFLAYVADQMSGEAEAWARDMACDDPPKRSDPKHYAKCVQIAFHQLAPEERRLLRAKQFFRMSDADLATRYDLDVAAIPAAVAKVRLRLDELTTRIAGDAS